MAHPMNPPAAPAATMEAKASTRARTDGAAESVGGPMGSGVPAPGSVGAGLAGASASDTPPCYGRPGDAEVLAAILLVGGLLAGWGPAGGTGAGSDAGPVLSGRCRRA